MKENGFIPVILIIGVVLVISFMVSGFTFYQWQSGNISTGKVLSAYIAQSRAEPTPEPTRASRDIFIPSATATVTTAPRQIPTSTLTPTLVTTLIPTFSPSSTPDLNPPAKIRDCTDYCSDNKKYYQGIYNSGIKNCEYQTERCEYGCDEEQKICKERPEERSETEKFRFSEGGKISGIRIENTENISTEITDDKKFLLKIRK